MDALVTSLVTHQMWTHVHTGYNMSVKFIFSSISRISTLSMTLLAFYVFQLSKRKEKRKRTYDSWSQNFKVEALKEGQKMPKV